MESYFINNEEVTKATFEESMTESSENLNEYELEAITDQMQLHSNINIIINEFDYRIEREA